MKNLASKFSYELHHESRHFPAFLAFGLIGIVNLVLSENLTLTPGWLLLPLVGCFAISITISRFNKRHRLTHYLLLSAIIIVTLSEVSSVGLLVFRLIEQSNKVQGSSLLRDALLLWAANVLVFTLWYWHLDAGGNFRRMQSTPEQYRQNAELVFPQLTMLDQNPKFQTWKPIFSDYLFMSFNVSSAFSPTDTLVLSIRIKWLYMLQASLSLIIIATLAARAVNILPSQ